MARKILFLFLSLFLIQQSWYILRRVHELELDSWVQIIFIAWIINLFITGIFAFAGFGFPTQKLMPQSYYHVSKPKMLKRIYNALGVNTFRKMLLATLWKNKNQRKKFFNGKSDGIATLEEQSMKSDFGHIVPFFLINLVSIYLFTIGLIKLSICCILINFIGNYYPVILQRHHRMRIQRLRKRQSRTL